jgi:hypothetical protein
VQTLLPQLATFDHVDWLIGNHPDELTLWIPILASRSTPSCRFMILPCCFYELSGQKMKNYDEQLGKYESYLRKIQEFCADCGYQTQRESLRIPSTKNIAIVGKKLNTQSDLETLDAISALLEQIKFIPRKSDREKTLLRLEREKSKNSRCEI